MLNATWKGLLAHKLRLALSAVAVVLGVAFVAGSYIFTDTLNRSFTQLFEQTSADVVVLPQSDVDTSITSGTSNTVRIPRSAVETAAHVEGVARAQGDIMVSGVRIVDAKGKVVGTAGAPGISVNWTGDPSGPLTIVDGRAPKGAGEVAIDTIAFKKGLFAVGDTITLVMPQGEPIKVQLVGSMRFGEAGNLAGATLTAFDQGTAEKLLTKPGEFTGITITVTRDATPERVAERVAAALGADYQVKTGKQSAREGAQAIEQGLGFLSTLLLAFAAVALFVGCFIILNTFSMIVAQRTRELALMRAIGASRGQITRSVLLEALVVGVAGSLIGVAAGAGIAKLLQVAFTQAGLDFSFGGGLVFAPRTVVVSLLVGIIVTLAAAYVPARRAGKVPPAAALRADAALPQGSVRRRSLLGAALTGVGIAALAVAATDKDGSRAVLVLGFGVLATLLGVIAASPAICGPLVHLIGTPVRRLRGTVGRLSVENAERNPRRTSATASALMIGLALVSAFAVLAASLNASVDHLVDSALGGSDFLVADSSRLPFTPEVASSLGNISGVSTVVRQRFGAVKLAAQATDQRFTAIDTKGLTDVLSVDFTSGSANGLVTGLIVDQDRAAAGGWSVGDVVPVAFVGGRTDLPLVGIYAPSQAIGSGAVSLTTFEKYGGDTSDQFLYIKLATGGDRAQARVAVDAVLVPYPGLAASDRTEFKAAQRAGVNQILFLIYALLGLAILIAVLGIVNTLALSVIERTREIGLLRAVGMSRRQLRSMVRWESFIIAVYGAVLGLVLGVLFGTVLQRVLSEKGFQVLAVPYGSLTVFLVLAGLVGVLAALWPARRAARLDVLRAVTSE